MQQRLNNVELIVQINNQKKEIANNKNGQLMSIAENQEQKPVKLQEEEEEEEERNIQKEKWHLLSLDEICRTLQVNNIEKYFDVENPRNCKGLPFDEVNQRFIKNGPNELTPMKERSAIIQYLMKYLDPFMVALNIAGGLSLIVWLLDTSILINLYLALVLFVIVILSSTFAYIQEGRSRAVMAQFTKLMPSNCSVMRDGKTIMVKARDLVIGDIVRINAGDRVPADMRLFWINELKIETSALTGESMPVTCTLESQEQRILEASNIAWSSCNVMDGEGYGIVIATGDNSMIGHIHRLTDRTESIDSTLQKEIRRFVYILAAFSFIQAILFFCIAMARHKSILTSLVLCFIVIMVANVPQGLPSTVISLLVIIGKRLAEQNVNVKRLQNVETLGSCTVIASDKTGTITQNKMTVSRIWIDNSIISADIASAEFPAYSISNNISSQVTMTVPSNKKYSSFNILSTATTELTFSVSTKQNKNENENENENGTEANENKHESEMNILPIHTLANLELVASLCNRARFENEKQLTDEEAFDLYYTTKKMGLKKHASKTVTLSRTRFMEMLTNDKERQLQGDASDRALFKFISSRQSIELLRYQYLILFELPFSSNNKYALTIIQPRGDGNGNKKYLLMKGAPEIVLTRCAHYHFQGFAKEVNKEFLDSFDKTYQILANDGERVLGFAMLELTKENFAKLDDMNNKNSNSIDLQDIPTTGYEFVGLMSLIDPPKPKVKNAVLECRNAGVKIIMVTGDHPLTAKAIATEVGIITQPTKEDLATEDELEDVDATNDDRINAIVVQGKELDTFKEEDWQRVLNKKEIVFARTTPEHKLKIVEHLQSMKHIVAVTGDGVNDAPALKKADIGVAMGISGSDVARAAGDIVIMDDDFSSIVVGVKEGRVLFDNLTKATAYTLSHLWPEVAPVLLNIAFDIPLAMNSLNVLCIDCGTELAPAISLAYEKSEEDVMTRPPRDSQRDRLASWRLLSYSYAQAGIIETLTGFLAFLLVFAHYGIPLSYLPFSAQYWVAGAPDMILPNGKILNDNQQAEILSQAQTLYWFSVVVCQVFHVFINRTRTQSILKHGLFGNMVTNYGVCIEILLIMTFIFVPGISNVLVFTYKVPKNLWPCFLVGWCALGILNEGVKYQIRSKKYKIFQKYLGY